MHETEKTRMSTKTTTNLCNQTENVLTDQIEKYNNNVVTPHRQKTEQIEHNKLEQILRE